MHNTALAKLLPKNKALLYKGVATNALGWALPSVFRWNRIVQVMKYRFNILRLVAFFYLQTNHLSLGGKRPQKRLSWNLVVKALIIARQQKVMPTQGNSSSFLWKEGAVLGLVDLFALPCMGVYWSFLDRSVTVCFLLGVCYRGNMPYLLQGGLSEVLIAWRSRPYWWKQSRHTSTMFMQTRGWLWYAPISVFDKTNLSAVAPKTARYCSLCRSIADKRQNICASNSVSLKFLLIARK